MANHRGAVISGSRNFPMWIGGHVCMAALGTASGDRDDRRVEAAPSIPERFDADVEEDDPHESESGKVA